MDTVVTRGDFAVRGERTTRTSPVRRQDILLVLLSVFGYLAGTQVGLALTPREHPISTLWPPNAILLAALLLAPTRLWPVFLIAIFPVHMLLQLSSGIPLVTAMGWFATNTGEALLGAASIRMVRKGEALFASFRGVLTFILFALLATTVTSFLDAGVVVVTGFGTDYWALFRMRLFSNLLAALTVVPPIVTLGSGGFSKFRRLPLRRHMEAIALAISLVAVTEYVFTRIGAQNAPALIYLLLPFLLWATVRFGSGGVSAALLLTALLSIWNVVAGRGPFASQPLPDAVFSLQVFLGVINIPFLALAGVLHDRQVVEEALRRNERYAKVVSEIAANFVHVPWQEIEDEIERGLEHVRILLDVDRITIFEFIESEGFEPRYSAFGPDLPVEAKAERLAINNVPWATVQLLAGRPVLLRDLAELPEAAAADKASLEHKGIASYAIVPLWGKQDRLTGVLALVSLRPRPMWQQDLTSHLQILGEVFCGAIERKTAAQALAESDQRFRNAADAAPMLVWMSSKDGMRVYCNRGWLEFTGSEAHTQLGAGWLSAVHQEDRSRCLLAHETALADGQQFRVEYRLRRHDGVYRTMLGIGVPRRDSAGILLGFVGSDEDITDRKAFEEATSSLSGKLINAQEEERHRIARELHDDIGQRLALLMIGLDELRGAPDMPLNARASTLWDQANEISQAVRHISRDLHAAGLDYLGLPACLEALCRHHRLAMRVEFKCNNVPSDLAAETRLGFYRVAQEALQNVSKHSHALNVTMELKTESGRLILLVRDDGSGFEFDRRSSSGLGLASMRERLKLLHGTLTITSAPAQGTSLEASSPLVTSPPET